MLDGHAPTLLLSFIQLSSYYVLFVSCAANSLLLSLCVGDVTERQTVCGSCGKSRHKMVGGRRLQRETSFVVSRSVAVTRRPLGCTYTKPRSSCTCPLSLGNCQASEVAAARIPQSTTKTILSYISLFIFRCWRACFFSL